MISFLDVHKTLFRTSGGFKVIYENPLISRYRVTLFYRDTFVLLSLGSILTLFHIGVCVCVGGGGGSL